jgi:hypothetical protein
MSKLHKSSLRCYGSGLGMPAGTLVPNWMTLIQLPKGVGQFVLDFGKWDDATSQMKPVCRPSVVA